MSDNGSDGARPRLAIVYGPGSMPPMELAAAASEVCDLLWVVDSSDPKVGALTRLLGKLAPVVDIAGLSPDDAASLLSEHRPEGITAYHDNQMVFTAYLADRLGLKYHSPEVTERLVNKSAQRGALRCGGVAVPHCWDVPAGLDGRGAAEFASSVQYPAVLKPRCGAGSRDTMLVQDANDLLACLVSLRALDGEMLLEGYLPDASVPHDDLFADYVSVESIVDGDRIRHIAVTGRFPVAPPFRESGFFIPDALPREAHDAVQELASAAITALGVQCGCLHTEIKLTPDGPRVIEVNGRIGGGLPEMLLLSGGYRLLEQSLRLAIGDRSQFDQSVSLEKVGFLFYYQAPQGSRRITSIGGLEALGALDGVEEISVNRQAGDEVDWREGNHGYVFSVTGVADDHAQLRSIYRFLMREVRVAYEGAA